MAGCICYVCGGCARIGALGGRPIPVGRRVPRRWGACCRPHESCATVFVAPVSANRAACGLRSLGFGQQTHPGFLTAGFRLAPGDLSTGFSVVGLFEIFEILEMSDSAFESASECGLAFAMLDACPKKSDHVCDGRWNRHSGVPRYRIRPSRRRRFPVPSHV